MVVSAGMAQQRTEVQSGSVLIARILSALTLAPPVMLAIYFGSPYFELLVVIAWIILAMEWQHMTKGDNRWFFSGLIYLGLGCFSLIWLREDTDIGKNITFWLFFCIWAMDCGAYFFGKTIGGPKLVPRLSPKKTWAGLLGGMVSAASVGILISYLSDSQNLILSAAVSALVGGISQSGDLLESFVKRRFNVKDSSKLIPGHGGLMDRVDGLLAAAIFVATVEYLFGKGIPKWF